MYDDRGFGLDRKELKQVKRDAKRQRKNIEGYLKDIEDKRPWQPGADDVIMNALIEKAWPTTLGMLQ